jgi:hypothetical protein
MRIRTAALAAICTFAFAGTAAAGAGQCFYPGGQPVGPLYNTDRPNYGWIEWVQRQGGTCRGVSTLEEQGLRTQARGYPPEFAGGPNRGYRPPAYQPPPGYTPPGEAWDGDSQRARYVVREWLAYTGRPYARVRDTGRVIYRHNRRWRIFFARWNDGGRLQVAARLMRSRGEYVAMRSYDGMNWTAPQPIGR